MRHLHKILKLFLALSLGLLFSLALLGLPPAVQAHLPAEPDPVRSPLDDLRLPRLQGTVGATFTYQGRLLKSGAFLDGVTCDFQFELYDDPTGGSQVGGTETANGVDVTNGYFTVNLNFGDVFDGQQRFLAVELQCPGDTGFIPMSERIPLNATPYALRALSSDSANVAWGNVLSKPTSFTGTLDVLNCNAGQVIKSDSFGNWSCDSDLGNDDHGALSGLGDDDHLQYLPRSGVRSMTGQLDMGNNRIVNLAPSADPFDAVRRNETIIQNVTAAGGDLGGTYPNPSVIGLQGRPVASVTVSTGEILRWDGSSWQPSTAGGDVTGVYNDLRVVKIQNKDVQNATPLNNQVLRWSTANNRWEPKDVSPSGAAGGDLAGSYPNPVVAKIQGNSVSTTDPQTGQILKWDGSEWVPADDEDTAPTAGDGIDVIGNQVSVDLLTSGGLRIVGSNNELTVADANGDVTGAYPSGLTVEAIQGRDVLDENPSDGEVLKWNGTLNQWEAQSDDTGGSPSEGDGIDISGNTIAVGLAAGSGLQFTGGDLAVDFTEVATSNHTHDHGSLTGLTDDDHPQYLLTDGSRTLTGDQSAGGNKITNLAAGTANGDAVRFEQAIKVTDTAGGDLSGTYPNPTVRALQGVTVAGTAPISGQVLKFNGTTSAWAPGAAVSGGSSLSAGDGLAIANDVISTTVSDFAGAGLVDDGSNNLAVNPGDGLVVANDILSTTVSDFAGAGLVDDGSNNLAVNASGGITLTGDAVELNLAASSGLTLTGGGALTVEFGTGPGQVAQGNHDHLGQSWSGNVATGLAVQTSNTAGTGLRGEATAASGTTTGVYGRSASEDGYGGLFVNSSATATGTLLAASDANTTTLEFRVDKSGNVFADGGYHCGNSIPENPVAISSTLTITPVTEPDLESGPCLQDETAADFAEMLPASQSEPLEPGDVLVIDLTGQLSRSSSPYQATVVGVYSTRPSYLGNSRFAGTDGYAPLAIVGVVPVKVSAESGPIQPGDMLVASSTPGHAMRCPDPAQCFGRTIGKALAGLETGTGVIQGLISLQ